MLRLPILFLSLLAGTAVLPALARADCECLWQGSFTEVQQQAALVLSGSVVGSKGNSVDFQVERILRGTEYLPRIRVWMQTGDLCRPPAETFAADSQWVLALHRIEEDVPGGFNPHTPNVSYGRVGDYHLSSCGGYWLSRSGDWVTGNLLDKDPRWVRDPKMTPVLLDLLAEFVAGRVDVSALAEASREDPALRELKLDTRAFLRDAD
jgi:hypothetical protein